MEQIDAHAEAKRVDVVLRVGVPDARGPIAEQTGPVRLGRVLATGAIWGVQEGGKVIL